MDAKLTKVDVDLGDAFGQLTIVTNAPNAKAGTRVIVATVGAIAGGLEVKKRSVSGVQSHGMLCDSPTLGWKGGAAGVAATVPDSFEIGAPPPPTRPRMDGK